MLIRDTIIPDAASAAAYDRQAEATKWHGPEIVFGLAYEFIGAGQTVLDLGIGSGLSSVLFHKAGLRVLGLDASRHVLQICEAKGFASELREHDLRDLPLPFAPGSVDHAVSVAVLHSFRELGLLFGDIARIMKSGGILAFTLEDRNPDQSDHYCIRRGIPSPEPNAEEAVQLFRHRPPEVAESLRGTGLTIVKTQDFRAYEHPTEDAAVFFKAYIARKSG